MLINSSSLILPGEQWQRAVCAYFTPECTGVTCNAMQRKRVPRSHAIAIQNVDQNQISSTRGQRNISD